MRLRPSLVEYADLQRISLAADADAIDALYVAPEWAEHAALPALSSKVLASKGRIFQYKQPQQALSRVCGLAAVLRFEMDGADDDKETAHLSESATSEPSMLPATRTLSSVLPWARWTTTTVPDDEDDADAELLLLAAMFSADRKVRFVEKNRFLLLVDGATHCEDWLVLDVTIPTGYSSGASMPVVLVSQVSIAGSSPECKQHVFAPEAHPADEQSNEPQPMLLDIYEKARDWLEGQRVSAAGTMCPVAVKINTKSNAVQLAK